jgi:hypothetical protein
MNGKNKLLISLIVLSSLIYLGIYLGTKYSKNSDTGESDKKWKVIGGFLGGLGGLLIMLGLYFYIKIKPNIQTIIPQSRIVKNNNELESLKNLLNISE